MLHRVITLQIITVVWMLIECGVAIYSSMSAHSLVLLAFGGDSLIELLSAVVVILQFTTAFSLRPLAAARIAGALLLVLAALVISLSVAALAIGFHAEMSVSGMAITVAALVVMPVLSRAKRKSAHLTGDRALAADAVQSATCAYLAAITLGGLVLNAVLHVRWIDPLAALIVVPVLCIEAKRALSGHGCDCCC